MGILVDTVRSNTVFALVLAALASASCSSVSVESSSATTTPISLESSTGVTEQPAATRVDKPAGDFDPMNQQPLDNQGNPKCAVSVFGWSTFYGEPGREDGTRVSIQKVGLDGINPAGIPLPDQYQVTVHTNDGRHHTQTAAVDRTETGPWDGTDEKFFVFREINPADVAHVLISNKRGTCWVDGQP